MRSNAALRRSMTMRCSITRPTAFRANPLRRSGYPWNPACKSVATDQPCRIWQQSENLIENGILIAQISQWKSRFPLDVDLDIKDRVDFSINGKPFSVEILTVKGRPVHDRVYRFAVRRHVIATGRTVG